MYRVPDDDEVVAMAAKLGFRLDAADVALYRESIAADLEAADVFVQSRVEETAPRTAVPARAAGARPDPAEDPFNAWVWKCSIAGTSGGVLAGKRVSFKDHVAVAGIPMSIGSFALEGYVPEFDASVVTRVLDAGATVVGKNVMDGLSGGFGYGGGIGDYGRPRNPHGVDHITGGSSSGGAAAVAAGEVDVAFGGDQGGSIRIPAALCGVVGLKPTFGLISHFGAVWANDHSVDHLGPLARTVEDAAAALQATAGYDGLDPRQGRDVPDALDVLTGLDGGVAGLRIGVLEEGCSGADPGVAALVSTAVDVLAAVGASVSRVSIPEHLTVRDASRALRAEGTRAAFDNGLVGVFQRTYYPASLMAAIHRMRTYQPDALTPRTKIALLSAEFVRNTYHGRVYAKAQNSRPHFIVAYDDALRSVDVLVMPTALTTAPRATNPASREEAIREEVTAAVVGPLSRNSAQFNFTGHPALAVPVGKLDGLPASMQLVGRRFDDALLLRVAYAYAHAVDWDRIVSVEAE